MLLDIIGSTFLRGGRSSHHWNWSSIRKITRLTGSWFFSTDSEESYDKLREYRENVNYTQGFTDPYLHNCLASSETDIGKRFRSYRDDDTFLYTYLPNHLAIAYPTKLIFALEAAMRNALIYMEPEKVAHIRNIWKFKDRCPMS